MTKRITIYTDGACEPNPGPGAWGAVITMPDGEVIEIDGFQCQTTNQQMELLGPILALERLGIERRPIVLFSDSQYVVRGITQWIGAWKRNGWINSQRKPVKNRELWERLDKARARKKVTFQWVRGHDGDPGNERADFLARRKLLSILQPDERAFREAVKGFSRHHDFDPTPYLEGG